MPLPRGFYTLAPWKRDIFLGSSPVLVILEAHLWTSKLLVTMGYGIGMMSRGAREDRLLYSKEEALFVSSYLHAIAIKYCKLYTEEYLLPSQVKLTLGHHLHLLGTANREEVNLFPEYSLIHGLKMEFGEDNCIFVSVVSEKEECYHYLVPTSYSSIVGVNL